MKKRIIFVLVFIISFINIFSFSGCSCKHNWVKISNTATCGDSGTITYRCNLCKEEKTETGNPTGNHKWIEISDTSSCTDAGVITYKCEVCNQNYTKKGKIKDHDYLIESVDQSICAITYQCKNCNNQYVDKEKDHIDDSSGSYCLHCNGNYKKLAIELVKEKGNYVSEKNVYQLKKVFNTHTTILQYEVNEDVLWLIDIDESKANGTVAMMLANSAIVWIGIMLQSEFYYKDVNNYKNSIYGTMDYKDLKYSNRTSTLNIRGSNLVSNLISSYSKVVHQMLWRAAISTTFIFLEENSLLNYSRLGFVNLEN